MENILVPLNGFLTIKSAAILRAVSKLTRYYIKVKDYNYYPLFKRMKFTKNDLLKLVIRTDRNWLTLDSNAKYFYDINFHKNGKNIKEYVSKLNNFQFCVKFISKELTILKNFKNLNIQSAIIKEEYVYHYCIDFVRNFTMCGIFSQLCIEKYNIM